MRARVLFISVVWLWAGPLQAIGYLKAGSTHGVGEPLEVTSLSVRVEVDGRIAMTHLDQVITNRGDQVVEGICGFTLPAGAYVTDLFIWDGDTQRTGVIANAGTARERYETWVRTGTAPAVLASPAADQYRLGIYPFAAHASRRIELEYTEVLEWQDGALRYRLPLAVTDGSALTIHTLLVAASLHQPFPFTVEVGPRFDALTEVSQTEGAAAGVLYADEEYVAPDDFEMALVPTGDARIPVVQSTPPTQGDTGYYALWVPSPTPLTSAPSWPRSVTFAIDISTSMAGTRLTAVREALEATLVDLGSGDLFNVVAFGNTATALSSAPLPADADGRASALAFLDGLQAKGVTNFEAALREAFGQPYPEGRVNRVVLVTDSAPALGAMEATRLSAAAQEAAAGRTVLLSAIGIGALTDRNLLDDLARAHRGTAAFLDDETNLSASLRELFASMALPVFIPDRMELEGAGASDVHSVPGVVLLPGQELFQVGRYQTGGQLSFALAGPWQGGQLLEAYPLTLAPAAPDTAAQTSEDAVLFYDDFKDSRGGWQLGFGREGNWELDPASGVYRVTVNGVSGVYVSVPAQSYTIETRIRHGNASSKVIYAGADHSEDTQVDLLGDPDGSHGLAARLLRPPSEIAVAWVAISRDGWYDVRIEVGEGTVTLYVNGIMVHDHVPTPGVVADGCIGIGSYGPGGKTEFDYVRVLAGTDASGGGYTRPPLTPVARLWAHHQVLSQEADAGTAESITEIRKLGYSYGLVTSQTALLVSSASLMACLDRPTSTSDHLTLVENAALDLPPAEARALRPVLAQNVPNPFNAETEIRFSIPVGVSAVAAELDLLNLAGQRLRSWSFEGLTPGDQAVVWDGRDNDGRPAASGVYLCRLQVGGHSICRRLALLR